MINGSPHEFIDISSEQFRTYIYPPNDAGCPVNIYILNPTHLSVSESGGHRILDANGMSYYINPGWICVQWKAKPGSPNFVK